MQSPATLYKIVRYERHAIHNLKRKRGDLRMIRKHEGYEFRRLIRLKFNASAEGSRGCRYPLHSSEPVPGVCTALEYARKHMLT